MLIQLIGTLQGGFSRVGLLDAAGYRLESFVTVTGDANNDRFITRNSSLLNEFLVTATSVPPAGSVKIPSVLARSLIPSTISSPSHCHTPTAGLLDRVNDVVTVCRLANRDRTRDRVGLYRAYQIRALMKGVDDRSASSGLPRVNFTAGILH